MYLTQINTLAFNRNVLIPNQVLQWINNYDGTKKNIFLVSRKLKYVEVITAINNELILQMPE